jgi:23S rRNA (cytosine1962-C5)-methyltransferase
LNRGRKSAELLPGRERSVLEGHPWIFSGAIKRMRGEPEPGETVSVVSAAGQELGNGAFSPASQIRVRMWGTAGEIDRSFLRGRLLEALALRSRRPPSSIPTDAMRLVNAESDRLPGLIVDRYADYLVCQFLSAGAERFKEDIVSILADIHPCKGIFERSDTDVREKEGLPLCSGPLAGDPPPELVEITEGPCRFAVDVMKGQKTGFFLDQRENRARVAAYCQGAEVLNCFSYSGAFSVWAIKAGAAGAVNLDESEAALRLCRINMELNGVAPDRLEEVCGNAFKVLRVFREEERRFDAIILDPPRFVDSRRNIPRAARGYKDINLLAMNLLRPGGYLFTFSCSGLLLPELFFKIVSDAALDAGRETQILERLFQAPDHPVSTRFPEGAYLKGLICRVL